MDISHWWNKDNRHFNSAVVSSILMNSACFTSMKELLYVAHMTKPHASDCHACESLLKQLYEISKCLKQFVEDSWREIVIKYMHVSATLLLLASARYLRFDR